MDLTQYQQETGANMYDMLYVAIARCEPSEVMNRRATWLKAYKWRWMCGNRAGFTAPTIQVAHNPPHYTGKLATEKRKLEN